jgi:antitoxin FitA-like protein
MDILVEIDDEVLLQLLLMAKGNRRSLNEEMLDILEQAARPDPFRVPARRKRSKHDPR